LEDHREETEKENQATHQVEIAPEPLPSCKKGGFFS
jgi:hypothetical protein